MELSHQTKGKAPFMKFCKQFFNGFPHQTTGENSFKNQQIFWLCFWWWSRFGQMQITCAIICPVEWN